MMESKKIINMLDTKYSAPNTIHQVNQLNLEQKNWVEIHVLF